MIWPCEQADLEAAVQVAASAHSLPYSLVAAMVEQESNWDPWALRYEPMFYLKYVEPLGLSPTEAHARSFSWGLLQVMGQTARELGYKGPIPKLCEPDIGLDWGCLKLAQALKKHNGDQVAALLTYNGGGNQAYPSQVIARMPKYPAQITGDADLSTQV